MSHIIYVVLVNELWSDDPWSVRYNLINPPVMNTKNYINTSSYKYKQKSANERTRHAIFVQHSITDTGMYTKNGKFIGGIQGRLHTCSDEETRNARPQS